MRRVLVLVGLFAALSGSDALAAPRFPDLQTLPPRDLRFDRADVSVDGSGDRRNVLRFSNTVTNQGEGKLLLRGTFGADRTSAPAIQHVYDETGASVEQHQAGTYTWHAAHQHYHFDDWGRYELWTKAAYDSYVAQGRPVAMQPDLYGSKTTSCIMDEEFIKTLPGTPWGAAFPGSNCDVGANGIMNQGLSVGWGDTYDYYRQEQWIDLGQGSLSDGDYVLRSVTDPFNHLHESPGAADPAREGIAVNEAITPFRVVGGQLADLHRPSGTVFVNGVNASTSSSQVTVRLIGRDDVSGVTEVRVSNDGQTWATHPYGGAGSEPMVLAWDLADSRYGGSTTGGTRTVYAQFRDASGKWSASETDTITFSGGGTTTPPPPPPSSGPYTDAVLSDSPVSWWRLGEASGSVANDQRGRNNGSYSLTPGLGVAGLLGSEPTNRAVAFSGDDRVNVTTENGLAPGAGFSLEAWIRPTDLPVAGQFRSIATRAGSYSLQFNGPLLEWTVIQGSSRRRLQAPAGAVAPGGEYHVVGTYDGATQRLYVDGVLVATRAQTGAASPGGGFNIGAWPGGSEYFKGTIDEVAYYASVLPGLNVKKHHDTGIAANVGVATPTGVTATATATDKVSVTWADNANNETGYVVERATNSAFTGATRITRPAGATSLDDTGLTPGTAYFYRVQAVGATSSSAWSAGATATTRSLPAAPTGLAATAASSERIDVTWADNAGDETGYVLERATSADFAGATRIDKPAGATSHADTGLAASTAYFYRVRAVRSADASAWSGTASATTQAGPVTPPPAPAAPTGLTATAGGADRIALAWADNAGDETGYVVERASNSAFTGATRITLPAGATAHTDTGLAAGTAYWYRVQATGAGEPSAWSGSAAATTSAAPVATYASTVLADNPLGFWRLDETSGTTARDARGVRNGSYRNGAVVGSTGLLGGGDGRAVRLDGANDYVHVPHDAALAFADRFTLEAWVKPAFLPTAGSFASLVTKPESYSLQFNGGLMEFTVIQGSSRRRLQAPAGAVQPGGTYHVVGTYDGVNQRLYVNGTQVASRVQAGPARTGTSGLHFGSWNGGGEFLGGSVDEVAVYNATLGAARVRAHYDAGAPAATISAASIRAYRSHKKLRRKTKLVQHKTRTSRSRQPLCLLERRDKRRLERERPRWVRSR